MASKESFFIRSTVTGPLNLGYHSTEIDLGHVVDALGQAVMRIHNISVSVRQASDGFGVSGTGAGQDAQVAYQLTTNNAQELLFASDRAVVTSGCIQYEMGSQITGATDMSDVLPQRWTNGFIVGVDSLFLGINTRGMNSDVRCDIVMECTVEKLSQNAAVALALSQQ
jgi:hypothetical protein